MLTKTDLFELLSVKNKDFQIHDHDPLFTVEDSENLRGEIKGAHTKNLFLMFDMYETEAKALVEKKISLPAYDQCLKASHIFNILDARGAISVAQRAEYIGRIREITKSVAKVWVDTQV